MLWELNANRMIMVTNLVEGGKVSEVLRANQKNLIKPSKNHEFKEILIHGH